MMEGCYLEMCDEQEERVAQQEQQGEKKQDDQDDCNSTSTTDAELYFLLEAAETHPFLNKLDILCRHESRSMKCGRRGRMKTRGM